MKKCAKCKIERSLSQFYGRHDRASKTHSYCKSCHNQSRIDNSRINKAKGIELLGTFCSKCGYSGCQAAMHFHHPDPALKDDMWRYLRCRSWKTIKTSLVEQKCILLCANCHAETHFPDPTSKPGLEPGYSTFAG